MNESLRTQIITALNELSKRPLARSWHEDAEQAREILLKGSPTRPDAQAVVTRVLDRHNIIGQIVDRDHVVNEAIDNRCATCKHLVILQQPPAGLSFYSHVLINPFHGGLSWL